MENEEPQKEPTEAVEKVYRPELDSLDDDDLLDMVDMCRERMGSIKDNLDQCLLRLRERGVPVE